MGKWIPRLLLCAALTAISTAAGAQAPTVAIGTLEQSPTIDGVLSPDEWTNAATLDEHLIQLVPEQGQPSPFRTIVRIGQTASALYVAFECHDPDPSRIAAAVVARDGDLDDDDSVALMLDTFLDQRTAYSFQTNALATQWDGRIADNGRTVDRLWDEAWSSATRRLDDRWTAEIKIPFSILRFELGSDQTWGLSFVRTVPRRLETSLWSAPTENQYRVSNFGTLTGLTLERLAEKSWYAIPYALAMVDETGQSDVEVGGDIRWRPTSALAVDLTANPDFALVEADVEQINLSRFELFVPEKRPFFLEGSETFQQRIRQFHSRRIGDITWGGKAFGTVEKTSYSALITSADVEIESTATASRADYGILRAQRSLPGGSTLGLLAANRLLNNVHRGSIGLDTTLFFSQTLGFTSQLIRVHGPSANGGLAWFVRPAYDSNTSHFHVRYTNLDRDIKDDFNAVGFLPDEDRREWDTNIKRTVWLDTGVAEKLQADINYNRFYSQGDILRSWELEAEMEVVLRSKWEAEFEFTDEYQLFEKKFYNRRIDSRIGWDGRDGRSVFGFVATGRNFDSDLTLYGGELGWTMGAGLRLSYELTRLELKPDPEGDTTWIHVFESVYSFNPNNFFKLFVQSNSAIQKTNVQALWVWRFRPPFGSLQVAYQTGTSELGEVSEQEDTAFTKFAWVF